MVREADADLKEADAFVDGAPVRYGRRVALARTGLVFTAAYLDMLRQAEAGDHSAAAGTGERIARIVREAMSLPGPAAFARHPSATETQMALDRLRADVDRYRKQMEQAK